jgi:hypothetical protein
MYGLCASQLIFHTNSWSTCSDGVLDAEETKELVKHLQFGAIQHRKSQPSKQTSTELPLIQMHGSRPELPGPPPPFAFLQSRSHSSIRLKQTKDTRAVVGKTAEDDAEKRYEIITVKAYFL